MLFDAENEYFSSPNVTTPYFLFISDNQYKPLLEELSRIEGVSFIKVSDSCKNYDKIPDIDDVANKIETVKNNCSQRFVVIGLGEYLALCGNITASRVLSNFKNKNLNGNKAILLLRGLDKQISSLQNDPRFFNRLYTVIDNAECLLSFTLVDVSLNLSKYTGFKSLLAELENGRCGNIICSTNVDLSNALFIVNKINGVYEGIKFIASEFTIPYTCGSDTYWSKLFSDLNQNNRSFDDVYKKYNLGSNLEKNFNKYIVGADYYNWIYFIALKSKTSTLSNSYLRYVVEKTDCFDDFSKNILNEIIEISHTDSRFGQFYSERKSLIEKFSEADIADFILKNRKIVSESIYKLTDNTKTEREEIIAWISKNKSPPQLNEIYPALADYLKKYIFKCQELSNLLTDYFDEYKRQKLLNNLNDDFLVKVNKFAQSPRKYNQLPTRDEVLDKLDKSGTFLYWLDALGVEYLSFIESLSQKRNLSISTKIARSELPTITSINRNFYDTWEGQKEKNNKLDEVKHKEQGGYNFENNSLPIHLVRELDIITDVLDKAATELAKRNYKKFLIVSDHGASRLAVLHLKEEKYDTDTKGEHSGRCCKLFQNYDLPFATEENGYLILADYGRFKGSRKANVEVHGGASLEEVVVPIIELTLKNSNITVELIEKLVTLDYRNGIEIKLFFTSPVHEVSVILNGKRYQALQHDTNHYVVQMLDIKRVGNYTVNVYIADDLIDKITFKVQGKMVNTNFDDLL